jgi:serine protease
VAAANAEEDQFEQANAAGDFMMAAHPATGESVAKVVLGLLMALGTAATLRSRQRNPLGPALLVAMTMAAAGAFFIPAPPVSATALVPGWVGKILRIIFDMIELPIPDWGRWIFGPGLASPIFYSALIPIVASIIGYNWKGSRQVMGGLCIGFAAFMTYTAWSAAPGLAWMPFTFLAIPWLLLNSLVSLFLARALIRKVEA